MGRLLLPLRLTRMTVVTHKFVFLGLGDVQIFILKRLPVLHVINVLRRQALLQTRHGNVCNSCYQLRLIRRQVHSERSFDKPITLFMAFKMFCC